jgi:V/A-type H+-transporting ATPase subunit A
MSLLQQESKLEEIVKLVGMDALSARERLIMETAKSIREDFLFQNAFDYVDAFTPLKKQYWNLRIIMAMYKEGQKIIEVEGFEFDDFLDLPIMQKIVKAKEISHEEIEKFEELEKEVIAEIIKLGAKYQAKESASA